MGSETNLLVEDELIDGHGLSDRSLSVTGRGDRGDEDNVSRNLQKEVP